MNMIYSKACDMVRAEAIDLGLSIKWASCNVGALSPGDEGGLYAWGKQKRKRNILLKITYLESRIVISTLSRMKFAGIG